MSHTEIVTYIQQVTIAILCRLHTVVFCSFSKQQSTIANKMSFLWDSAAKTSIFKS